MKIVFIDPPFKIFTGLYVFDMKMGLKHIDATSPACDRCL